MNIVGKIKNRYVILCLAILFIAIIGYFDYKTGAEFGFSFFYLLPISLLSLHHGTKRNSIILCSLFASILWFIAEYLAREYSSVFFPIWNALVRLIIFISIGLLLFYLKEKELKLKALNSNLKNLNEEKNKFIGIAAHDIRGPIGVIYSFTDLLIREYNQNLTADVLEILEIVKKTSTNSITVLENLLDVSKIESGKLNLNFKSQDYISFIKNQIHINQILAKNKDIEIVYKSQNEMLIVDFDEHYFSEVIGNLVSNAIKYSNRNTQILVQISLMNNNQLLTEIIDQGIGINELEQQNLFKYFQKTSSRPTEGEESTGLGLAISKQIIIQHKGIIGVKSAKNKGSNFYFQIPVKQNLNE
uniref:sensor histidine kinase n=3 Tax=Flavobacterium sp. TaxID=239 RepID=UPI00404A2A7F